MRKKGEYNDRGKNIVIIGFMATGKTATSKSLADKTGMIYVGVDDEIEKREGMAIKDIFEKKGQSYFRAVEKEVINEISSRKGYVIDCGGGAVLDPGNMEMLMASGKVFCLNASPEEIYKRVKNDKSRPLLAAKDVRAEIERLLGERKKRYLSADHQIDTSGMTPLETAGKIKQIVEDIPKQKADRNKKDDRDDETLFELFFEKILNNVSAPLVATGKSGDVKFVNLEFYARSGRTKKIKELKGESWIKTISPGCAGKKLEELFGRVKKTGEIAQFFAENILICDQGKPYLWTIFPISGRNGDEMYLFLGMGSKVRPGKYDGSEKLSRPEIRTLRRDIASLLFEASEKCDPETAGHAMRCTMIAEEFSEFLGLSRKRIEDIRTAALLHDLGKLAVDPGILFKKGKLTADEFDHVKKHIVWGADLLGRIHFLMGIVDIMASHHENYDGTGYPEGLSGDQIPLESRILSVVDIYEALTADRPYRGAFSLEEAIAIMEYEKGHKLDPRLTDIFMDMMRGKRRKK